MATFHFMNSVHAMGREILVQGITFLSCTLLLSHFTQPAALPSAVGQDDTTNMQSSQTSSMYIEYVSQVKDILEHLGTPYIKYMFMDREGRDGQVGRTRA